VTPLLAVTAEIRAIEPDADFLLVGTTGGPERELAESERLRFVAVPAGKLRRYWDAQNATDVGRVVAGIARSLGVVRAFRPMLGVGAGGFASVAPLAAARVLGVPVIIHQQDVQPGLANRLLIPLASAITLSLPASLAHFPPRRSTVTGNPVRPAVLAGDARIARARFALEAGVPTVLVTGGGTGALELNRLVAAAAPERVRFCQVIHLTGRGRAVPPERESSRYRSYELLTDDMPHALAIADVVVSRAGMGTMTELAALGKPALVVPMPRSHQLANAQAFGRMDAIEVADQDTLDGAKLAAWVRRLLDDPARRAALSSAISRSMPRDAGARIARVALGLLAGSGAG
jgi:UDP-N-acetylglucosamine--N-acetylmuramyl-(pentapeptide) pyrophosphoryl-undecaprenol N-acetylglucosamine transferase